jgi:hypothetical protein
MNSTGLNWPPIVPRFLWVRRKCPLCSSIEFKSAEPEWLDGVLVLFRLNAVRCVNCWRRYYWFHDVSADEEEQSMQRNKIADLADSTKGKLR